MSRCLAAVSLLFVIASATVQAQDWPQWRGPNRDGKVKDFVAPEKWPDKLAEKWKVEVGEGDSSPVLVGDKLYIFARQGGDEVTLCLNAADGKEIWKDKYATAAINGPAARGHAGPRATPAVADGKIVTLGVNGALSCLDAAAGKLLWRNEDYKAVPRFFTGSSPLIADGAVIAQLGSESKGTLVSLDLATGKANWTLEVGCSYASPVLMSVGDVKQIVTLSDKAAIGVDLAAGKLLWDFAFAPAGMSYNAATPIVDGSIVYITGQGRGTKALKIEKADDKFAAKEVWSNPVGTQFNSPLLKVGAAPGGGGVVIDGIGFLYGLSDKANFFCINTADGKSAWTDTAMRGPGGRGGAYCAMLDAGPVILALTSTGELVVFKPDPKAYTEVAKIKLADNTIATPVVAGKRIFVKDQKSVSLLALE